MKLKFLLATLLLIPGVFGVFDVAENGVTPPFLPGDIASPGILLRSFSSKEIIHDIHVRVDVTNLESGEKLSTLQYVPEDGMLRLPLLPVRHEIMLRVDDIATIGKDYYFKGDIDASVQSTVYLLPVGSVRGVVTDDDGRLIPGVSVRPDCSSSAGDIATMRTDDAGSFNFEWLPVGSCTIIAWDDDMRGSMDVSLEGGSLVPVTVVLDQRLRSSGNIWPIVLFVIIIVILFGVFSRKFLKRNAPEPSAQKRVLTSRQEDVMRTLSPKERDVVELIHQHEGRISQATIKNDLAIPKTSLVRILMALELKKVVRIEKVGRQRKVYFTDWFKER